nr:integrase, catalytic region, zinc finger, CCHC-type, peptidase aspartic, catalytic [Tanacetum cinerariifolium]
ELVLEGRDCKEFVMEVGGKLGIDEQCVQTGTWEKVQTLGSGISIILAVGTPSTGSGNLYCQWELSPGSVTLLPWSVDNIVLRSFCVKYFEFELLEEENLSEQSRLGIFLSKEIFEGGVIRIHNAFVHDEVVQIILWYLDSGCSKHMTGDRSQLVNFVQKFLGMVKFGNDHVAKIIGYGDYQIGNVTISRVYYVEGIGHNLFSVGQFCDSDLEVAFRQHTCFIRNLDGVDLLTGSRGNNLYTYSVSTRHDGGLVRGLPKLKFEKDHLCSACAMGKSTNKTHKPKSEDTNQEKLYLLHMDLCGPMHVESVNGKKIRVVEIRNRTLIEAAHTMLIYAQAPLFLWAEAVATACFTQNRSIIRRLRHGKTPYELLDSKLPDLSFFHVFSALCYPKNDSENLGKLQPKADIEIFIGYASTKKDLRIYN